MIRGIDSYSVRARLQPMLLVILPAVFSTLGWIPADKLAWGVVWSVLGATGFTYLLSHLARDSGKQAESGLWRRWGGKPTTQRLRFITAPNRITLERYHRKLEALLGRSFPNEEEERNNLVQSEEVYDAAVTLLRDRTRSRKDFPLIYKELVNYGFRRNLYGMRRAGIVITVLSSVASTAELLSQVTSATGPVMPWVSLVFGVIMLTWWCFRINHKWVREAGFEYADRLLEASERL